MTTRRSLKAAFAATLLSASWAGLGTGGVAAAREASATHNFSTPAQEFGRVSFDARSLMIDGERKIIWSSEFHYFRLTSPDLWRDILQKLKASGFNTVALYFSWGYHSPAPGVYDFTSIRDVDRLLTMAAEEGLYVMVRPGPYINAELARGGFPGWLVNQRARARSDDPEYLAAADEWLTQINAIIARHQINGDGQGNSGTVILYQIENELGQTSPAHHRYMEHLYAKVRSDGITVPIFHNDKGRNGYWVPESSDVPFTVSGPTDLYAWDSYPGSTCSVAGTPRTPSPAPDFGFYGIGGARGGSSASPSTPGFAAEFGGGWFDYWGSNGTYGCNSIQRGPRYQRVFYGTNLANGIGIQSFYMGYGGTSWGWMSAPVTYTSYDYGAAISEVRTLREKAKELRQLGGLIAAVPDLAGMIPAGALAISSPEVQIYHNASPETDARFLLVAANPSSGSGNNTFHFDLQLPDATYRIPSQGGMQLNGFDAKWLIANTRIGGQQLVYSTSELQSALTIDGSDLLLLYGRKSEDGETVLRFASEPSVEVVEGEATAHWDARLGNLILRYSHDGLARIRIGGTDRPVTLLIADEATGWDFWQADTALGDVLVRGPSLLRHAAQVGDELALHGDTAQTTSLEVWLPAAYRAVTWNGESVATQPDDRRVMAPLTATLSGPQTIVLPQLTGWRMANGSPETSFTFDDSAWLETTGRRYSSITPRPDGQPNLLMDPYGFHSGDVWYRGRFQGSAEAERLNISYGAGGAGMIQVFLDGEFIEQAELPAGLPRPITLGSAIMDLPDRARTQGEHVLSILLRNNGHNWDLDADDYHKEARGLISVSLERQAGRSFAVPISWRINGRGEDNHDPVRGVMNNGGLWGEFAGWHLPEFSDEHWASVSLPQADAEAGVTWYRTNVALDLPQDHDVTIGLAIGDPDQPRSPVNYRASIFVNGWNMGQFIAHVGPQRIFPMPEGILNHNGPNTIAIAVISDGQPGNALEQIQFINMHTQRGGLDVKPAIAPFSSTER